MMFLSLIGSCPHTLFILEHAFIIQHWFLFSCPIVIIRSNLALSPIFFSTPFIQCLHRITKNEMHAAPRMAFKCIETVCTLCKQ